MSGQPEALRLATCMECSMGCGPIERSAAAELRRQHSRIEADEALMRQVCSVLEHATSFTSRKARDRYEATITALRARLETPNAS